jgi:methylated-DNA-[protein]-cysteine S-methyltransferase
MDTAGIYARETPGLERVVQIGLAQGRVIGVDFPESVPEDAERDHPLLDRLAEYVAGGDDLTDVTVGLTVPTDQRGVLEAVRELPVGETVSLDQLVRLAGLDPEDADDRRTAESALRNNPVPLFVPDHRVEAPGATPDDVRRALRAVESG